MGQESSTGNSSPLQEYSRKRDFSKTPEPQSGNGGNRSEEPVFVVQKHAASRLHYDFRLEVDGVLKSWAVPKGPSMNPNDKRLAVMTEDHPLDYATFEGRIPEGEYGGGTVIVWDQGTYQNLKADEDGDADGQAPQSIADALAAGEIAIRLNGEKLRGGYALINSRMGGKAENWLLIKMKDAAALPESDITAERPESVVSGRTIEDMQKEE